MHRDGTSGGPAQARAIPSSSPSRRIRPRSERRSVLLAWLTLLLACGGETRAALTPGPGESTRQATSAGGEAGALPNAVPSDFAVGVIAAYNGPRREATEQPDASSSSGTSVEAGARSASAYPTAKRGPKPRTEAETKELIAKCKGDLPLFTPVQERTLQLLEASGRADLVQQAADIRTNVKEGVARECEELRAAGKFAGPSP
jgi:hypothetical protein